MSTDTNGDNAVWAYTRAGRLSGTIERGSRPVPELGRGDVRVRVKAAALNPVDEQLAQSSAALLKWLGCAVPSPADPLVPTTDFSGVVEAVGSEVDEFSPGDDVFGQRFSADGNGFLAEHVVIPASAPFVRKPPQLGWTDAAAVPLVYSTVYDALVEWGRLPFPPQPQDKDRFSVLVLGGSSGTGHVAVQLAKFLGCRVVATCSGANAELVRSLGADEVIDYTTEHVVQRALNSAYAPYAVVMDCVGGTDFLGHLDNLLVDSTERPELGIYVTIVGDKTSRDAMGGAATNWYNPAQAVRTALGRLNDYLPHWTRSWTGRRYACIKLDPTKAKLATYDTYAKAGGKVLVDSVHAFAEAPKAYERLESARAKGKVVVSVDADA